MFIYGLRIWLSLHHTSSLSYFLISLILYLNLCANALALCECMFFLFIHFVCNFRCRQNNGSPFFQFLYFPSVRMQNPLLFGTEKGTYCRTRSRERNKSCIKNLNQGKEGAKQTSTKKIRSEILFHKKIC